eukprot:3252411-Amphidinium_carterae.1
MQKTGWFPRTRSLGCGAARVEKVSMRLWRNTSANTSLIRCQMICQLHSQHGSVRRKHFIAKERILEESVGSH